MYSTGMMKLLKKQGWVVCLLASPECIFARIQHDSSRPLLRVPNPLAGNKEQSNLERTHTEMQIILSKLTTRAQMRFHLK